MTINDKARHTLEKKLIHRRHIKLHELNALDRYGPRCPSMASLLNEWDIPELVKCRHRWEHTGLHAARGHSWASRMKATGVDANTFGYRSWWSQRSRIKGLAQTLRKQGIHCRLSVKWETIKREMAARPLKGKTQSGPIATITGPNKDKILWNDEQLATWACIMYDSQAMHDSEEEDKKLARRIVEVAEKAGLTVQWDGDTYFAIEIAPEEVIDVDPEHALD